MKINLEQWPRALSQGLVAAYWISTDEPLLQQEALDVLRQTARKSGYTREIFDIDAHFNWDDFLAQTQSLHLFSQKQLIECRMNQPKLGDKGVKALNAYLDSAPPDVCVVLISPKIDAATQKTQWFTQLSQRITWLLIWPPQGSAFTQEVKARLHAAKLNLTPDAIALLAEFTEGNMLALKQAIDHLTLLPCPQGVFDFDTCRALLFDASNSDVYTLVDIALSGDTAKTIRVFHQLIAQDTPPVLMLWAWHQQAKQLYTIRLAMDAGASLMEALGKTYIFANRKPLVQKAVARVTMPLLSELFEQAAIVDAALKGANSEDGENRLLDLYISLSGTKLNIGQDIFTT